MKKLVFIFSLILSYYFIGFTGVSTTPVLADEFTNGNIVTVTPSISEEDLNTYNNALQVLEYLRQGGTIDFSNVSDNYTSGDLLDEFVDLIDTVGNGIDYYGNNILNNIFDLSTDTVQLSPNTKLKDRIGQFRSNLPSYLERNQSSDNPIIIPEDYQSLIDTINGSGFYFKNWENGYFNGNIYYQYYPLYNYSYRSIANGFGDGNTNYGTVSQLTDIISCYIYSDNNNNYSCLINYTMRGNAFAYSRSQRSIYGRIGPNLTWIAGNQGVGTGDTSGFYDIPSNTLYNVLSAIASNFRNVNIYVDGVPWSIVGQTTNYSIALNTGTYLKETNQPIEYKFDIPVYVDISDLIDKIDLAIDNKINLDFPYLEDLIVDTNGQQTIAVTVFSEDYTIDDLYVKDYGAMIPLFPMWVDYPVSLQDINNVATVGIVDVIPQDIIDIFSLFFIAMLLIFICHRLME